MGGILADGISYLSLVECEHISPAISARDDAHVGSGRPSSYKRIPGHL